MFNTSLECNRSNHLPFNRLPFNQLRASNSIYVPIIYVPIRHLLYIRRESSTNRPYFMQNKPNFQKVKLNVNQVLTKDYRKRTLGQRGKNKPNSNPIKANLPDAQMNVKPSMTKDYQNEPPQPSRENKPKQTCPERSRMGQFQKSRLLCCSALCLPRGSSSCCQGRKNRCAVRAH